MRTLLMVIIIIAIFTSQAHTRERISITPVGEGAVPTLYQIFHKDEVLWLVPLSEVKSITKAEWKDIWLLIEIATLSWQMDREVTLSIIRKLSPKRFIVQE